MNLNFIFYLPAVLFLISGIPQIAKLIKTKSSDDISVWMYILTFAAVFIVVVDSFIHNDYGVMVSNMASLATLGTTTFLILKYRTKKPII
jgi:MtN3 and saliva related transmembrane protein